MTQEVNRMQKTWTTIATAWAQLNVPVLFTSRCILEIRLPVRIYNLLLTKKNYLHNEQNLREINMCRSFISALLNEKKKVQELWAFISKYMNFLNCTQISGHFFLVSKKCYKGM